MCQYVPARSVETLDHDFDAFDLSLLLHRNSHPALIVWDQFAVDVEEPERTAKAIVPVIELR